MPSSEPPTIDPAVAKEFVEKTKRMQNEPEQKKLRDVKKMPVIPRLDKKM